MNIGRLWTRCALEDDDGISRRCDPDRFTERVNWR